MIRLENLHKSFGDLHVLKGIDLNIDKGEIVAIVGPSGSGKSTVLRCMNLLEEPTDGKIIFEGENITDKKVNIDKIRQNIGMVFQNFNLFPHMTVLDNITLAPIKIKKISKEQANEKAEILLDRVGLLDKKDAYPSQLSGGQKQRIAIARALAMEPDMMLFDEPTSALDPEMVKEVLEVIKTEQFSRIPVYNQTIDDIVGVLYVKDLIIAGQNKEGFKVSDYMREPYYTFEFKKIKELFNEMKKTRNHLSVVLDEYGGTVGIVTIEDLIEEVFGDIEDEYDDYDKEIEVVKEDEYIVDGSAKLDDISELIGVNMESEEFDSVGGLIIGELGRFPDNKEEVTLNKIRFVVEEVDKNRIKKVRIYT